MFRWFSSSPVVAVVIFIFMLYFCNPIRSLLYTISNIESSILGLEMSSPFAARTRMEILQHKNCN
jgi:hypothetical protein